MTAGQRTEIARLTPNESAIRKKIVAVLAEDRAAWNGKSRRGLYARDIAGRIAESEGLTTSVLWGMWSTEDVERTVSGTWYRLKRFDLNERQQKLYDAVRVASRTATMTGLATAAGMTRVELRPALTDLEKIGAITEQPDGWYKANRP